MEQQTPDPTTVADRAEFSKMLKKREKEAIRNQINANKIFNKQEQERKERLSETGKAWEVALGHLKKPRSPAKSTHSATSSMETHPGGSVPKPEGSIAASSVGTQDSVTSVLSGQAGHLDSSRKLVVHFEPEKEETQAEPVVVPKTGGPTAFARLMKSAKSRSENANSEVSSSTVADSLPVTVIPVVQDHMSAGQIKPNTGGSSSQRSDSVATMDTPPAGAVSVPVAELVKKSEDASSFRAAMERRRQRNLLLQQNAAGTSKQ